MGMALLALIVDPGLIGAFSGHISFLQYVLPQRMHRFSRNFALNSSLNTHLVFLPFNFLLSFVNYADR
jgi:hypothetical protein